MMRRYVLVIAMATSTLAVANPAQAALIICTSPSCVTADENVLFNGQGVVTGTALTARTNQTNTGVLFQADHMVQASGGQASLTDLGGNPLTGTVSFNLVGFNFGEFELNFPGIPGPPPPPEASSITFTILDANGNMLTTSAPFPTYALNGNGQNFFGGFTTGGDVISKVTWTLNPSGSGVDAMSQLRVGALAPIVQPPIRGVPEPSTWLMMLMGFGAIGATLRTRKRKVRRIAIA